MQVRVKSVTLINGDKDHAMVTFAGAVDTYYGRDIISHIQVQGNTARALHEMVANWGAYAPSYSNVTIYYPNELISWEE